MEASWFSAYAPPIWSNFKSIMVLILWLFWSPLKKQWLSHFSFTGHKSILDNEKGSWLISTICKVFQQHAYIAHLHSMLAEVNKQMGCFTSTLELPYKSTAEIQDSLDHHYIYFQPSMTYEGYCKKFNQCWKQINKEWLNQESSYWTLHLSMITWLNLFRYDCLSTQCWINLINLFNVIFVYETNS